MYKTSSQSLIFFVFSLLISFQLYAENCSDNSVTLQILGSGGPEIDDKRASSSYLIWVNHKAEILIDFGGGASLNYELSGADFIDLKAIVFTHFHVDHSADFPVLIKGAYFTDRDTPLLVYGPEGNQWMPSTSEFLDAMFSSKHGSYSYLTDVLDHNASAFRLVPHTVILDKDHIQSFHLGPQLMLSAIAVHHGPIPALAWRVDVNHCAITFSGDMNNDFRTLVRLAKNSDILVAHHAIPENMTGVARNLHMPPSQIGSIAGQANVKKLVISHRMNRTLGRESESLNIIKCYYSGPVIFANDLDLITP